jgi:hypothetical protein
MLTVLQRCLYGVVQNGGHWQFCLVSQADLELHVPSIKIWQKKKPQFSAFYSVNKNPV